MDPSKENHAFGGQLGDLGPSQVLWRQVPPWLENETRSSIGGCPRLPDSIAWPTSKTHKMPLNFVAQICCEDIHPKVWGGLGPRAGWLMFFVDSRVESRDPDCAVLHVNHLGQRRKPPEGAIKCFNNAINVQKYLDVLGRYGCTWPEWPVDIIDQSVACEKFIYGRSVWGKYLRENPGPQNWLGLRMWILYLLDELIGLQHNQFSTARASGKFIRNWPISRANFRPSPLGRANHQTHRVYWSSIVRSFFIQKRLIRHASKADYRLLTFEYYEWIADCLLRGVKYGDAYHAPHAALNEKIDKLIDQVLEILHSFDEKDAFSEGFFDQVGTIKERLANIELPDNEGKFELPNGEGWFSPELTLQILGDRRARSEDVSLSIGWQYTDSFAAGSRISKKILDEFIPFWQAHNSQHQHTIGGRPHFIRGRLADEFSEGKRTLILQLSSDSAVHWMWGDAGKICFHMSVSDLAKGDFSKASARFEGH